MLAPLPLTMGAQRRGTSTGHIALHGSNADAVLTWTVEVVGERKVGYRGDWWSGWVLHRTWEQRNTLRDCSSDCTGVVTASTDEVYVPELGLVADIAGHTAYQGGGFTGSSDFHLALDNAQLR